MSIAHPVKPEYYKAHMTPTVPVALETNTPIPATEAVYVPFGKEFIALTNELIALRAGLAELEAKTK